MIGITTKLISCHDSYLITKNMLCTYKYNNVTLEGDMSFERPDTIIRSTT